MASTIKDIAQRLNVSVSTVSYALNGGPRQVPERTRRRVLEVAAELQYRPNRLARALQGRRSHVLGIVPTVVAPGVAIGPYFVLGLDGIIEAAAEAGHDVLVYTGHSSHDDEAAARGLADGRSDGILFLAPRLGSPAPATLRALGFPHVVIDGEEGSGEEDGSLAYGIDNLAGIDLAVGHLAGLGHRRIAHLAGPSTMRDGIERRDGFRRAMAARGLAVDEALVIEAGFDAGTGRGAAIALLDRNDFPTAVVCANDEVAHTLVAVAAARGLRVPEDLSIVGFDDSMFSQLAQPGLTTVAQPIGAIARAATAALVRLVEGSTGESSTLFAPALVVRHSTAPPKASR